MDEAIRITEEELELAVCKMYINISTMPIEKIKKQKAVMYKEFGVEKGNSEDCDGARNFIDLLIDTCIKAAKRKGHQDGPYVEPVSVAEVKESLPRQDDSISFAI